VPSSREHSYKILGFEIRDARGLDCGCREQAVEQSALCWCGLLPLRADAIRALRSLITSVTVYVDRDGVMDLEVEAPTSTLIDFAKTRNAPGPRDRGRSAMLVAGVGFEPTTFRL
jgi:hypothetical protein